MIRYSRSILVMWVTIVFTNHPNTLRCAVPFPSGASIPPLFVKFALYMFKDKIQESLGVDPYTVSPLQWLQESRSLSLGDAAALPPCYILAADSDEVSDLVFVYVLLLLHFFAWVRDKLWWAEEQTQISPQISSRFLLLMSLPLCFIPPAYSCLNGRQAGRGMEKESGRAVLLVSGISWLGECCAGVAGS